MADGRAEGAVSEPGTSSLGACFHRRGLPLVALPSGGMVCERFSSPSEEHLATRRGVGIFDFSFMGWWAFRGTQALACLQRLQTRDLRALAPGRLCYTLVCRADGSVEIDATVWRVDADSWWLFTGRRSDAAWLRAHAAAFGLELSFRGDHHAVIAVQGPSSPQLVEQVLGAGGGEISYFAFRELRFEGARMWIGRLGYTGELGYELLVPVAQAARLWSLLAEQPFDGERRECGMQAANALRIEAGFIHFAHELAAPVWPAELGLARLLRHDPPDFKGAGEALRRVPDAGRRLVGVRLVAGGEPPPGSSRIRLTSEASSPLFGGPLGLAFVGRDLAHGRIVGLDDGRVGRIVNLPFRASTSGRNPRATLSARSVLP